jgi:hypothetical protein
MNGLYLAATILPTLWGGYAATRLRRGTSVLVAMSSLCMVSAGAWMGLIAARPELLRPEPVNPVVASAALSLGLLATWTFLGVLAAASGQTARPLALVAVPLAAAAAGGLIQALAPHAAAAGPAAHDQWSARALASQCFLSACYCPAEGRITVIAWQFSRRVRIRHIRWGMRAVAAGAAAEAGLILARAVMISSYAAGEQAAGRAAPAIAVTQAAAVLSVVAGTTACAWVPALSRLARQVWLWSAYWRLRPLWTALRQVIPEVTLPRPPGVRLHIRYRLDRRVIEIRDAQLALRAYVAPDVPGRAGAAARSARLDPDTVVAVEEAAVIASAFAARRNGQPPRHGGPPGDGITAAPGNDLHAEAARLILVARAFRHSPIVRRIAGWAPSTMEQAGTHERLPAELQVR